MTEAPAFDRRSLLLGGAAMSAGLALIDTPADAAESPAAGSALTAAEAPILQGPYVDLRTAEGNVTMWGRSFGDLNPEKQRYGWYTGKVMAVVPGGKVRELFGFTGFGVSRSIVNSDGTIQILLREVGYYTDLKSGEILEEYKNPFHGETVKVVPVANDPFNRKIEPYALWRPDMGGLNAGPQIKRPFIQPWEVLGDKVRLYRATHLYYKNALDPAKWPRESAGAMVQASEFFLYDFKPEDIQDRNKTAVRYTGTWARITPWLPWMLMGAAPGHCMYQCFMGTAGSVDELALKRHVIDYTEKNYPRFMNAPDKLEGDSLSSLEVYARTMQPAPPRPAGAAPFNMHPADG